MADSVNIPLVGKQPKRVAYLVGGVVVIALGVGYYRVQKSKSSASTATTSQIDPATGYAYGTSEDAAALAQQAGYVSAGSLVGSDTTDASQPSGQTTGFTNNAQWSQAAIDFLTGTVGSDSSAVASAIGKYLAGDTVTPTEMSYVQQAIAVAGKPPVAGINGYPPSIRQQAAAPSPKIPAQPPAPRPYSVTDSVIWIQWVVGAGGTYDQVQIARNSSFTQNVSTHDDTNGSPGGWSGLSANTEYYTRVRSRNGAGYGTWSAVTAIKTKPRPAAAPKPRPAPRPVPVKKSTQRPAPNRRTYIVRSGDNLFNIANRYYGNGNDWRRIYSANRGKIGSNPSLIHPGLALNIP